AEAVADADVPCNCICACNWSEFFTLTLTLTLTLPLQLLPSRCTVPLLCIVNHQHPILPIFRWRKRLRSFSFHASRRSCLAIARIKPPDVFNITSNCSQVDAHWLGLRNMDHRITSIFVARSRDVFGIGLRVARLDKTLIADARKIGSR